MAHAEFHIGDLTAVIGDNAAQGEHRAGYNGIWSLRHKASVRTLFVPAVAGLNFEHIFSGEPTPDARVFFEPRNAPMNFRRISESEAELHQPPTPTFHLESWTRFKLVAPHYIDMRFRCVAHEHVFPRGYIGLFWASYINAPADKSMYFLGREQGRTGEAFWMQLCTQSHNDESTVRHRNDPMELTFAPDPRDTLFKNYSRFRYDEPFYYGLYDGLTWIMLFDRSEGICFTHSPSGGGANAPLKTTHPAWDFQFIIPKYEVMREYSFNARAVFRPYSSRDEVVREYRAWKSG